MSAAKFSRTLMIIGIIVASVLGSIHLALGFPWLSPCFGRRGDPTCQMATTLSSYVGDLWGPFVLFRGRDAL